jgi:predicted RNA-binding Zn-ribbon protein involved in translation (DUF1610 family)
MKDADPLYEWLVCSECGFDEFSHIPFVSPGHNAYLECPECGAEAFRAG